MDLPELDPLIHQRTRLRVLTVLHRNRRAPFVWVRETLDLTPGNLDSHVSRLEEAGYLDRGRVLTEDGFQVEVQITPEGDAAFEAYLEDLDAFQNAPDADARS